MQISELSVRRPVFATVISLLLIIFGLVSMQRLAIREYPDIERPVVSITTTYRGASAQVVENKITQPIEDRIAGIEGILKIESSSEDERSSINIEFDVNRDLDGAANDVRDRVSRVGAVLPPEADPPDIAKANAGGEAVAILNFTSDSMSLLEISDYAERYIVDRISTVPGVARASLSGQRRYAMRIWLDRQALAARRMTVTDIESALRRENVQLPAGRLESLTREFSLRTEVGLDTEQDFRDLVVGRGEDGHLVRLGEVAGVQLAAENERTIARTDGRPGVGVFVEAQSKSNTLEVVRGVRKEVEILQSELPEGASLYINVDNALSIEAALHEVIIAVVFAFASVLLVIYGFLGNLRATLIPAVTIPVSIVAAFTVMYALGYSINVLTLLGLVLAIGLVVDDAIVVLENVHRRTELGEAPMVAAVTGTREIGFAVIATTMVLAAVFVPISFLPGNIGRLFREFGFTLAAAVLFSALVALTLTPMLASKLPPQAAHGGRVAAAIDAFFKRLAANYERWLRALMRRPWFVVGGVAVLTLIGGLTFTSLPSEFAPTADVGRIFVTLQGPEGASLEYTDSYARRFEQIVAAEREKKGEISRMLVRIPGTGGAAVRQQRRREHFARHHHAGAVERARSLRAGDLARVACGGACAAGRAGLRWSARQPRPRRIRTAGPGRHRRAGLRAALAVVGQAAADRRAQSWADRRRHRLQGAQAADPRLDQPRPGRRPRRFAGDRRTHARDRARLAHRHHVSRPRPGVQRDPAGSRRRAAHRHRPDQHLRAFHSQQRAHPAVERRRRSRRWRARSSSTASTGCAPSRYPQVSRRATRWARRCNGSATQSRASCPPAPS